MTPAQSQNYKHNEDKILSEFPAIVMHVILMFCERTNIESTCVFLELLVY